jgi:HK97 family phage major capsid protein
MGRLALLRKRIAEIDAKIDGIDAACEAENRGALTADEETSYKALAEERKGLEAQESAVLAQEERRQKVNADQRNQGTRDAGDGVISYEPKIYDQHQRNSYLLDVARWQLSRGDVTGAVDRLTRHSQELDVELPKREAARRKRAEDQLAAADSAAGVSRFAARRSMFERAANPNAIGSPEYRVNPSRQDGQGGYFVPPLWLVDEFIPYLRNGRPFMSAVRQIELPGGTDSINIPKVNTGTVTGMQADNGGVASQDLTDTFVTAPVRTIAGQQDIAMQLLDQSPVAFDEIVFADLLADYAYRVDLQGWSGVGTGVQLKGIDYVSGVNAVTYTDASPTLPELFVPLAQGLSQLARNRKRVDGVSWWMQAPRWYWAASQLDSSNRPLITPTDQGPYNTMALPDGAPAAQGPVGRILGTPVNLDLSITTTDGAGVNQDRVYAIRTEDLYLFEGAMRTRAMTEVLSGTLQVRLQVYNYVAFLPDRFPTAISVISGTGLTAPSGF